MTPVEKALWYIESRFREPFSLSDVAEASGVTRHCLIRAFGRVIGTSVIQYVKARRLSEAAKALASGAPDILSVAMLTGYQSHEAFSRAMRDHFGKSPSEIRDSGNTAGLKLADPVMLHDECVTLKTIGIEDMRSVCVTGLAQQYDEQSRATIPSLWYEFDQYLGRTGGKLGVPAYGVCSAYNEDGTFDYLCGVETSLAESAGLFGAHSASSEQVTIPAGKYASFQHEGHVSSIRNSWRDIYDEWLPNSEYLLAQAPEFELYSNDFDPVRETGSISLFVPLEVA